MDLDSRAQYKLVSIGYSNINFRKYRRILKALCPLDEWYDHETSEMWCSRIHNPFRKILKENPRILSGNGYITICEKLIERSDRVHGLSSNYIYCSVCDSLVFIPENGYSRANYYRDNHLKRCISGNSISNEHARRKDILQSIDEREFHIWQYKQFILQEETKINRLHLEVFSQSTSHSEKDKLASVSYDYDNRSVSYEAYLSAKATIAENTMPSATNFEPACISVTSGNQEMVSPNSYQSSNYKSDTGELFISSQYAKQPKGTILRLRDGRVITVV